MGIRPSLYLVCGITDRIKNDPRQVRKPNVTELFETGVPYHMQTPSGKQVISKAWLRTAGKTPAEWNPQEPGEPLSEVIYGLIDPEDNKASCIGWIIDGCYGTDLAYGLFRAFPQLNPAQTETYRGFAVVPKRDPRFYEADHESEMVRFCVENGLLWIGHDYIACWRYAAEAHWLLGLAGWEIPYAELQLFVAWGWE